jgi:DNA-3-methyladenine glycosylase
MRASQSFFTRDVLEVAPALLGQTLVRRFDDGTLQRFIITETEAYRGEEDKACHASKGRTPRTEVMFGDGGHVYVYLIYGMYWMLNVVTSVSEHPQAVLIRGLEGVDGPGRVGKLLQLNKSFYGESLIESNRIWIELTANDIVPHQTSPRVGIDYAGEYWAGVHWRYRMTDFSKKK